MITHINIGPVGESTAGFTARLVRGILAVSGGESKS